MPAVESTEPCPICKGRGSIPRDNLNEDKCRCLKIKELTKHLGPELWLAPTIRSPLYQPGEKPVDRTTENLFVSAAWPVCTAHFKWALGCKFTVKKGAHRFLLTTDERLLRIYLGGDAYGQRSKAKRDEIDTYNNLRDFIVDYDLLIIRLGFLGYPNKAMSGALKEALGIREVETKPTWLVDRLPGYPFGPGHLSYSDDLDAYIKERFDIVELEAGNIPVHAETPLETDEGDEVSLGAGDATSVENTYVRPTPTSSMTPSTDDEFEGGREGREGRFKPGGRPKVKKKPWGKRSGGSNPMGDL